MTLPIAPVSRSIVVMGVTGCGKTVVGRELAQRRGVAFADADDLHSEASITKMAGGYALDDHDREEWLDRVGRWLAEHPDGGVMACSALRRRYRDALREAAPGTFFVHLEADADVIESRVAARREHFMPASLVASQLSTLEPLEGDEAGLTITGDDEVETIVDAILRILE